MKKHIGSGALLLAALLAVVAAAPARAGWEFAKREQKSCLHCHIRPRAGEEFLNPTGRYYARYRRFPPEGDMVTPSPRAGSSPKNAWHPGRDPAMQGTGNTRRFRDATREVKALMARWTRSLGVKNCYYCHADRLPGASPRQIEQSRIAHEISLRHQDLVRTINATMGGEKVDCYTCHLGGRGPLRMP